MRSSRGLDKRELDMKRAKRIAAPEIATKIVAGKALRDKVPQEQHAQWKGGKGRPNPIDILHKSDAGRMKELVLIRYGRCNSPSIEGPLE
jgi:hypothetical protein